MRGQTENLIDIFEILVFITTESMSLFIVLLVSSLYLLVNFKLSMDLFKPETAGAQRWKAVRGHCHMSQSIVTTNARLSGSSWCIASASSLR